MKQLGDYEQLILLQIIMERPSIYVLELQKKLVHVVDCQEFVGP